MTKKKTPTVVILLLLAVVATTPALSQKRTTLTAEQQKEFLLQRLPSGAIRGTFGSFGSLLFGIQGIAIHTNDNHIGATELHSSFPDFYKPTTKELFEAIALQTKSSWTYDAQNNYWVFAKPANPKPFSIALAAEWIAYDRGLYVSYKPPTFPVGMDVYYQGSYSADDPKQEPALWLKTRDRWAINFAVRFKKDVTTAEMQKVMVDGVEALYFQAPTPRPGAVWRQWVFVKNGRAFLIVSTLPADDPQLLAAVESMVKSFHVNS